MCSKRQGVDRRSRPAWCGVGMGWWLVAGTGRGSGLHLRSKTRQGPCVLRDIQVDTSFQDGLVLKLFKVRQAVKLTRC